MNPSDHIEAELRQVAPQLASLPRSHPFSVPEGYFEGLEMRLTAKTGTTDENHEILFGSKEFPFRVPEDYFQELSSGILSKIKNENQQNREIKPSISFTKYLQQYKSRIAAASVAAMLIVSIALFTKKKPDLLALQNTTTESADDLLYAADLDESVVVDLYLQEQPEPDDSYRNESEDYLRDVVDLQPEFMNEF